MTPPPAPSCAKSGLKGPIVLGKMGQNRGVVQNLHLVAANENAVCQKKTSSELMAFPRKRILLDFFTALSLVWWWKAFGLFFFRSFLRLSDWWNYSSGANSNWWINWKLSHRLMGMVSGGNWGFRRRYSIKHWKSSDINCTLLEIQELGDTAKWKMK